MDKIPYFETLKIHFKNNTRFDADERPADFAAFLYSENQKNIKEAIAAIDNVKSRETITPDELRKILSTLIK